MNTLQVESNHFIAVKTSLTKDLGVPTVDFKDTATSSLHSPSSLLLGHPAFAGSTLHVALRLTRLSLTSLGSEQLSLAPDLLERKAQGLVLLEVQHWLPLPCADAQRYVEAASCYTTRPPEPTVQARIDARGGGVRFLSARAHARMEEFCWMSYKPKHSMCAIYAYIDPLNLPKVGIFSIHGKEETRSNCSGSGTAHVRQCKDQIVANNKLI